MNNDCLKLTTYFGERHRTEHEFVADALLDLYGRQEVQVSVMLRGAEGFGLKHHRRTDRLLTLSEDLPAPGRAGRATKLTIYVGRREQIAGAPAFITVCDLLHRRGIAGASALLGVDGTTHGVRQRARFFGRNADVPMMIIAVGAGEQIAGVLPELGGLLRRPLVTLERVRVCKRDGQLLAAPTPLPAVDEHGLAVWQKLMIYASEQARHGHQPLHLALVRRLRESQASGATCLRGIWGFHGNHAPHGDRLLQLRRHVPMVTIIVDTPERIARSFQIVDEMTDEAGLVTSEMVPALAALADGEPPSEGLRLARHRF